MYRGLIQEIGVLDLQTEQNDQGQAFTELYEAVGDMKRRHDLHPSSLQPRDGVTLRRETERETVTDLVKRFRNLPDEQRRKLPALLNSLAQLEIVVGEMESGQQDFQEVARIVTDPVSQAEAWHNVYLAALERQDYEQALLSLRRAIALDSKAFEPFPFSQYEPERILEADGFGVRFLCKQSPTGRLVVVRTLRLDSQERDAAAVLEELEQIRQLDHPALLTIHEAGYADDSRSRPYVVLEHFEGETLAEVVRKSGPMKSGEWLPLAWQIARALQALHGKGLLHRCLRPESVLLKRETLKADEESTGDKEPEKKEFTWRVKLADATFCLRRSLVHSSNSSLQARQQTALGRLVTRIVPYQPSETIGRPKGQVWVGPHSDVYSFGKVGLFALTGTPNPDPGDRIALEEDWGSILDQCASWIISARFPQVDPLIDRLALLSPTPESLIRIDEMMFAAVVAEHSAILAVEPDNMQALLHRINALVRQGDHERALADLNHAIELNPADASLYRKRAQSNTRTNRADEAIADYMEALRLEPRNLEALSNRALAWTIKCEFAKSVADYTEAIRINPRDEILLYNRGNAHYLNGDLPQSIADYTAVLKQNPSHAWALSNRGKAYSLKGDHAKAVTDFSRLIQIEPENVRARLDRAHAYAELNQYDRAIEDYSAALLQQPDAGVYLDRGLAYANGGSFREAIEDFTESIRLQPENANAFMFRGHARASLVTDDNFVEAMADLDESVRLSPDSAVAWYNRGNLHFRMGKRELAIADYTRALEANPDYYSARFNRGNTYAELSRFEEAIADYTLLIDKNPREPAPYTNRGNSRTSLGLMELALQDYDKALEFDPKDTLTLCNRANTLSRMGRFAEALVHLDEVIRLEPRKPRYYLQRGHNHGSMGNQELALADYDTAISLAPELPRGYFSRANLLARSGDYAGALTDYDKAISLAADFANAFYHRGNLHVRMGNDLLALTDYDQTTGLQPGNGDAWNNRGLCHQRQGNTSRALDDFGRSANPATGGTACKDALFNRAKLLLDLDRLPEALTDLDCLLLQKPDDTIALQLRSRVHQHLGEYAKAMVDLRDALALNPESPLIKLQLAWLLLSDPGATAQQFHESENLAHLACLATAEPSLLYLEIHSATLAATGRYSEAAHVLRLALEKTSTWQTGPDMQETIRQRLHYYQTGHIAPRSQDLEERLERELDPHFPYRPSIASDIGI